MSEEYLTPEDLSARWKLPLSTLSQWRWHRKGPPFVRMGKRVRYLLEGVEGFEKNFERTTNTSYEKNNICPNIKIFK
ncbi:MAG: hypothetical protein ACD_16C00019G0004 [uncultured bacterium]|nr:MAG: hypothetical protein ACD_16C00019G0004 [uncultured bacterium]HBG35407.1 DNA-binding protein [Holosporales bacterium]HBW24165.1 DNA-binding protein [Holosporales bacterium]